MDETGRIAELARLYALGQNPQTIMPIPSGPLQAEAQRLLQGRPETQIDPQGDSSLAQAYRQYAASRTKPPQDIVDSLRHKRKVKTKTRAQTKRERAHNARMRSRGR